MATLSMEPAVITISAAAAHKPIPFVRFFLHPFAIRYTSFARTTPVPSSEFKSSCFILSAPAQKSSDLSITFYSERRVTCQSVYGLSPIYAFGSVPKNRGAPSGFHIPARRLLLYYVSPIDPLLRVREPRIHVSPGILTHHVGHRFRDLLNLSSLRNRF